MTTPQSINKFAFHVGGLAHSNGTTSTALSATSLASIRIGAWSLHSALHCSFRLRICNNSDPHSLSQLPPSTLNCLRIDAAEEQHGVRPQQRRLPASSSTTRPPHSRHRYGPPRYTLAGGLHQPAADSTGQPEQASPAARRIRPAPCL